MSEQDPETYLKDPSNFSNNLNDITLHTYLHTFFIRQRLSKCNPTSLEQILSTNLNSHFIELSQHLSNKLTRNEANSESKCLILVEIIDTVYDYLKAQLEAPKPAVSFQQFGHFFLSTTQVCCNLLGYLKLSTPSGNDLR